MDAKRLFDFTGYIHGLGRRNKLALKEGFYPCVCSGINDLEEVLGRITSEANFLCVEDTDDGQTTERNGGWFRSRTVTVYLLMKYRQGDMADRQAKMDTCRELTRELLSRMIVDRERLDNELVYLRVDQVMSRELSGIFAQGLTGLYFMLNVDEPLGLCYDPDEWTE